MPAKQRFTRTRRVYSRARSGYRRARGMFSGGGWFAKVKPVLVGAAGGLAFTYGKNFNPQFGGAAALGIVGFVGGNETLLTLAGIELAQSFTGSTTATSATGGWL